MIAELDDVASMNRENGILHSVWQGTSARECYVPNGESLISSLVIRPGRTRSGWPPDRWQFLRRIGRCARLRDLY